MKQKIEDNDLILIFKNQKKEILDDGFSKKVCEKLPAESNYPLAIHIIGAVPVLILATILLKSIHFDEGFLIFISHATEKFTSYFILFFNDPKIYISTFVALLIGAGFVMKKEMLF